LSVVLAIVCGCVLAAVAASAGAAGTARHSKSHGIKTYATRATIPLRTAVADPFAFVGAQYSTAFTMTRTAGATFVRISASWSGVAPGNLYPGFVASDPSGYSWSWLDSVVQSAQDAGLTPILQIGYPPSWALTKSAGGTKLDNNPDPKALGEFATALATHYDGTHGAPAVHIFQVWNEPNLSLDLSPASAANYRSMVNAAAAAVHAVDPANIVIAGGLDPFTNKTRKWYSVAPLAFMRALLCVSKGAHPHRTCSSKIHFDVWSHHPYTFGGPFGKARHPDDVSLGDLPKMTALLRAATRLHTIVSSHHVQFWVTEFGWDSTPPRRHAAPMALAARWTSESLYQMWRSGVSLVTWFDLQDQKSPSTYQSGLFFYSKNLKTARAKTVRTAFRFPFVAYLGKGSVSVWGRDATSTKTTVTIQRRTGLRGGWRTVARIQANRFGIFKAKIKLAATAKDWLRATAPGSGKSLGFSLTVPKYPHIGPWGAT
jgi:hypothetical protein